MTAVLTALGNRWDSAVATHLEASREVRLVRRCADLADLMATAASGLGSVAMVSEDLRGLDLTVVAGLRVSGILVVGLSVPGDEGSERRLRQLGIPVVVPARLRSAHAGGGGHRWSDAARATRVSRQHRTARVCGVVGVVRDPGVP